MGFNKDAFKRPQPAAETPSGSMRSPNEPSNRSPALANARMAAGSAGSPTLANRATGKAVVKVEVEMIVGLLLDKLIAVGEDQTSMRIVAESKRLIAQEEGALASFASGSAERRRAELRIGEAKAKIQEHEQQRQLRAKTMDRKHLVQILTLELRKVFNGMIAEKLNDQQHGGTDSVPPQVGGVKERTPHWRNEQIQQSLEHERTIFTNPAIERVVSTAFDKLVDRMYETEQKLRDELAKASRDESARFATQVQKHADESKSAAEGVRARVQRLESKSLPELQAQVRQLRPDLETQLGAIREETKKQLADLRKTFSQEHDALRSALQRSNRERDDLKKTVEDVQKQLTNSLTRTQVLGASIGEVNNLAAVKYGQQDKIIKSLEVNVAAINRKVVGLDQLQAQVEESRSSIKKIQCYIYNPDQDNLGLIQGHAVLEEQLEELRQAMTNLQTPKQNHGPVDKHIDKVAIPVDKTSLTSPGRGNDSSSDEGSLSAVCHRQSRPKQGKARTPVSDLELAHLRQMIAGLEKKLTQNNLSLAALSSKGQLDGIVFDDVKLKMHDVDDIKVQVNELNMKSQKHDELIHVVTQTTRSLQTQQQNITTQQLYNAIVHEIKSHLVNEPWISNFEHRLQHFYGQVNAESIQQKALVQDLFAQIDTLRTKGAINDKIGTSQSTIIETEQRFSSMVDEWSSALNSRVEKAEATATSSRLQIDSDVEAIKNKIQDVEARLQGEQTFFTRIVKLEKRVDTGESAVAALTEQIPKSRREISERLDIQQSITSTLAENVKQLEAQSSQQRDLTQRPGTGPDVQDGPLESIISRSELQSLKRQVDAVETTLTTALSTDDSGPFKKKKYKRQMETCKANIEVIAGQLQALQTISEQHTENLEKAAVAGCNLKDSVAKLECDVDGFRTEIRDLGKTVSLSIRRTRNSGNLVSDSDHEEIDLKPFNSFSSNKAARSSSGISRETALRIDTSSADEAPEKHKEGDAEEARAHDSERDGDYHNSEDSDTPLVSNSSASASRRNPERVRKPPTPAPGINNVDPFGVHAKRKAREARLSNSPAAKRSSGVRSPMADASPTPPSATYPLLKPSDLKNDNSKSSTSTSSSTDHQSLTSTTATRIGNHSSGTAPRAKRGKPFRGRNAFSRGGRFHLVPGLLRRD